MQRCTVAASDRRADHYAARHGAGTDEASEPGDAVAGVRSRHGSSDGRVLRQTVIAVRSPTMRGGCRGQCRHLHTWLLAGWDATDTSELAELTATGHL